MSYNDLPDGIYYKEFNIKHKWFSNKKTISFQYPEGVDQHDLYNYLKNLNQKYQVEKVSYATRAERFADWFLPPYFKTMTIDVKPLPFDEHE